MATCKACLQRAQQIAQRRSADTGEPWVVVIEAARTGRASVNRYRVKPARTLRPDETEATKCLGNNDPR